MELDLKDRKRTEAGVRRPALKGQQLGYLPWASPGDKLAPGGIRQG
jgi:hypothetical protein